MNKHKSLIIKKVDRKSRFCWNPCKDISLLHKVLSHRPWEYGRVVWNMIASELKTESLYDVTARARMLRADHLLKLYKAADMSSIKKSGTEEEYSERDQLLEEMKGLTEMQQGFLVSADNDIEIDSELVLPDLDHVFNQTEEIQNNDDMNTEEIDVENMGEASALHKSYGNVKVVPLSKHGRKIAAKFGGDKIRKEALDNLLSSNMASEQNCKRSKRVDFGEFLSQKMKAEERNYHLQEIEIQQKAENNLKIEEKRIESEERLATRRLEFEFENKKSEHAEKELERIHQEKLADQEHQKQLELLKERERQDEKMLKIIEMLAKK